MLLFAGDTHGQHQHLADVAVLENPDAIIHVGDFGLEVSYREAFEDVLAICPMYFVAGNHDFDNVRYHDNLLIGTEGFNLHGKVIEIAGLRVAGLAGNFQEKVWYPPAKPRFDRPQDFVRVCGKGNRWRNGLPLKTRGAIWWSEYERLAAMRADLLITHEAPGCHKYGFDVLTELAEFMGASMLVHGHHHERYVTQARAGLTVVGVGLRGVSRANGDCLRPGDIDDQREGSWRGNY